MNGLEKVLENFVMKKFPWIEQVGIDTKMISEDKIPVQIIYFVNEEKSFDEKKKVYKITEQLFRMVGLADYYILDGVRFRKF